MATVTGGDKLQSYLKQMVERMRPVTIRVGFLEGEQATKATILEYGAPGAGIPPRPFFRNWIRSEESNWPATAAAAIQHAGGDTIAAANTLGALLAGGLTEAIVDYDAGPPLSEAWAERKGFDKQLIWTGAMSRAVSWEVEEG